MANYRVQVANYATGALPADRFINTLYFTHDADPSAAVWDALFTALNTALDNPAILAHKNKTFTAYNMADVKPRPIVRTKTFTAADAGVQGPGEVALCLSYYSGRNLPRTRGRIYLGPLQGSITNTVAPSSSPREAIMTMAQAFKDAATAGNFTWVLHSIKDNDYLPITDVWCDNAWDTQRRRGAKATSRLTAHLT